MKIRLKDPSRVYFDRQTGKTFYGKGVFDTSATGYVREMINGGWAIEVEDKSEASKAPKLPPKED